LISAEVPRTHCALLMVDRSRNSAEC
jgi:hypothetical protein